jgi:hypothetical protein
MNTVTCSPKWEFRLLFVLAPYLLIFATVGVARGQVTYSYIGKPYTLCFYSYLPFCDQVSISGSFTVPEALAPNLAYGFIVPSAYSFTDGRSVNIRSGTPLTDKFFGISTDAHGDIVSWGIALDQNYPLCSVSDAVSITTDGQTEGTISGYDESGFVVNACTPEEVRGYGTTGYGPAIYGTWTRSSTVPLKITTANPLPDGNVGDQYASVKLQASGGEPFSGGEYHWNFDPIYPRYLPIGLSFPDSGLISGIPQQGNLGFGDPLPADVLPYELLATVTDSVGAQDHRFYSLNITENPQTQYKPLAVRSAYARQATTYSGLAAGLGFILFNLQARAACAAVPGCLVGIESMFSTYTGLAIKYWTAALDPPDPNYKVVISPIYPKASALSLQQGFTNEEINAGKALFLNLSHQSGLAQAMITSINRAQGAAAAGDTYWETRQLQAARFYAMRLSPFVSGQAVLTSTFIATLQAAGFPNLQVDAPSLSLFQSQIRNSGLPSHLPSALSKQLTHAGIDSVSINLLAWMIAELPVNSGAGSYPINMLPPALTSASSQTASSLEEFSSDRNGDLQVTCADLDIVKPSFGTKIGQSGFDPRADVNMDGVVNIVDLQFVASHIPARTVCQ